MHKCGIDFIMEWFLTGLELILRHLTKKFTIYLEVLTSQEIFKGKIPLPTHIHSIGRPMFDNRQMKT